MDVVRHYESPLGSITLASDGEAITGLWFEGQTNFGETLTKPYEEGSVPALDEAVRWLETYFQGRDPGFTPPIHLRGTAFRRRVWAALSDIPFGEKATYGALAEKLNSSARAVGGALAHNPVSLIVPCHRVLGADGKVTGYAGGIERKLRLLELEKIK